MKNKYISKNIDDTYTIAKNLVETLSGGEIIALNGELGSGKTVFAKGIAKTLGVKGNVNSPTFVLMKTYNTSNKKIKKMVHVDVYRLGEKASVDTIGLDDFTNSKDTIIIIEWFDYIKNTFSNKVIKIDIKHISENTREFSIS